MPGTRIVAAGSATIEPQPQAEVGLPGTWLLTYTRSGEGRYRVGRAQAVTAPGDLLLIHRGAFVERSVQGQSPQKVLYVHFDPWVNWNPPAPFVPAEPHLYRAHAVMVTTRQRIEDAFRRLIADVRTVEAARVLDAPRKTRRVTSVNDARLELAVGAIAEILLLVCSDDLEVARLDPRIVAALRTVTADLSAHHDTSALARAAGLSPSRFMHLFREQIGTALRPAIRKIRLQEAASLLTYGNEPVGSIAEQVGFSSIYAFSNEFRRAYGISPSRYRARFRAPQASPSIRP